MTGKIQVGIWFAYEVIDWALINTFHQSSDLWVYSGTPTEDINALIADNGYPTRNPSGTGSTIWSRGAYAYLTSDNWIITWTGSATVTPTCTWPGISMSTSTSANRVVCTFTSTVPGAVPLNSQIPFRIEVTGVAASNISDIRTFRANNETALLAGEIFDPDFITFIQGFGRVRFMDWMQTNTNGQAKWSHRVKQSDLSWVGVKIATADYCGTTTNSVNDYTCPSDPTGSTGTWTQGQRIQCTINANPTFATVTGFTSVSPGLVTTSAAHGFANGDEIFFTAGSVHDNGVNFDTNLYRKTFLAANVTSTTFNLRDPVALTLINTTGWGPWVSGGNVGKVLRIKTPGLPFKKWWMLDLNLAYFSSVASVAGNLWNFTYDSDTDGLLFSGAGTGFRTGYAIEVLVALCNKALVAPWFCIPTNADDDYVTQFATYVAANLNPALKSCWEWSNEVWNPVFNQAAYAIVKAGLHGWSTNWDQFYGWRTGQVMAIVKSILPNSERMISPQTGSGATFAQLQPMMEAPITGASPMPYTFCTSIAIAPYVQPDTSRNMDAQHVWQMSQGTAAQQIDALNFQDAFLRDDGAVFDGHVSGFNLTVDNLISGTIRASPPNSSSPTVIYSAHIPRPPSAFATGIVSGSGSNWVLDTSYTAFGTERMNTCSNYGLTYKFCKDYVFPCWLALAAHWGLKLTQYEGGWGAGDTLALTASSYSGYTFLPNSPAINGAVNNGAGKVRLSVDDSSALVTGQSYLIEGIMGTTEANGFHQITVINSTHVDLPSVNFVNAYIFSGWIWGDRSYYMAKQQQDWRFGQTLQLIQKVFMDLGGEFPANYTISGNWQYNINQGSGLVHPNRFAAEPPALQTLRLLNQNKTRVLVKT